MKLKNLFIPQVEENKKAGLLSTPAILLMSLMIFMFNSFTGVAISAETPDQILNAENLLSAHNSIRQKNNLGTLKINKELTTSATAKANAMLQSDCWSHYCPNGKSPWTFFDEAGYNYLFAGENLAEGFYKVSTVMDAWMNSETHRANILKSDYKEVGFGIVTGSFQGNSSNVIIAVHFGARIASDFEENRFVTINQPKNGYESSSSEILVSGSTSNPQRVKVLLNGTNPSEASILEGAFTARVTNLKEGDNRILAQAEWEDGYILSSNPVNITYQPEVLSESITVSAGDNLGGTISGSDINLSPEAKNLINLGFVVGIAVLFLIDFVIFTRTKILERKSSFSHYHFVLFLIVVTIILIGGFAGRIGSGILQ